LRHYVSLWALACAASLCGTAARPPSREPATALYQHIFVIVDENKGYRQLMDHPAWTPIIHRLATEYGSATQFYAEVHSSEADYIAMLGGDTFGIHDDDAFYCRAGTKDPYCQDSGQPGYANHDLTARSLMDQLSEKRLTWKAYMEDIPGAGSLVPRWPTADYAADGMPNELYAAKHNGFVNFRRVNQEPLPQRASHLVGFAQLDKDLASGRMPNYAQIVPNQCNDMHGLSGANVPADCKGSDSEALIRRGDAVIGELVDKIMHSKVWTDPGNTAIVVTFDENNKAERSSGRQGCCGYDPHSKANFGGGHIVTIVITNHGPRHITDTTPYNHYSLLRTTEAAFGIRQYLGNAANTAKGVVTMTPLFAVAR
jgi:phosphatidylinositol-3-phosphatase